MKRKQGARGREYLWRMGRPSGAGENETANGPETRGATPGSQGSRETEVPAEGPGLCFSDCHVLTTKSLVLHIESSHLRMQVSSQLQDCWPSMHMGPTGHT